MKQGEIIDGYEVLHSIQLNAVSYVVAQNINSEDENYRVYKVGGANAIGLSDCFLLHESHDYLNVMREYVRTLGAGLDIASLDRTYRSSLDFDDWVLKTSDCIHGSDKLDYEGQIVAVKAGVLSPEFRSASYQLHVATGGFGCSPTASGRAVYCTNIYDGSKTRFDRADIAGVVIPESIPAWAKDKIAQLQGKPSVLDEIKQSKQTAQERRDGGKDAQSQAKNDAKGNGSKGGSSRKKSEPDL